ncbi:MAG: choice-of-anchor D domain-containing protein, partial [Planctomycetaceae bacterium]|nr:choice-of-anchor D domain-containing protein [Planctomycetaceae bacterium]
DDIAGRDPVTGQWTVSRTVFSTNNTQQQSFTTSIWGLWSVGTDWTNIVTGDFTGDGRADLLGQTSTGEWWLSRTTGLGFAAAVLVGTWDASDPVVEVLSGDLNGDLRDDLIARTVSGTWIRGTTTFSGLDTRVLGHWADTEGWDQSLLVQYPSWDNSSQLVVASRNRRTNEIWMLEPTYGITQIRNLGAQGGTPMQRLGASQVSDQPLSVTAPIPQGPLLNPVRSAQPGIVDTPTPGTPVTVANNSTPVGGAVGVTKALTPPAFRGATYSYSSTISSGNTLLADNDVFVRVGSNWVYEATLAPEIVDYRQISSLAMDGNIVAIGDIDRGEVYVFERTGNLWTQTATLRNDSPQGGQYWTGFGRPLALQGNELLVADPARALIVVYQRTVDGWQRQTDLQVPEYVNSSRLTIELEGDRMAMGSTVQDGPRFVLVYERRGGVWTRTATIRESAPDYFYGGFTLSGDTLAIQGRNATYIYEYLDSGWQWSGTLLNGGTSPARPASIVGDRLVTFNYRTGASGVTQLYQRSATGWILMQEWINLRPMSFDGRTLVLLPTSYYYGGPLTVVTLATPLRPVLTDRTFTIPERLGAEQTVGMMVISNPSPADRTVYTIISGNAADAFRIDSATGRISVKRPERLNFETTPVFKLIISAVREGRIAAATATLQLQDIDDSPIRIVDDGDADFTVTPGSFGRGGFQGDSRALRSGTGSVQATWTFPGLVPGVYRVTTTWRNSAIRATDSPFTISDAQQVLTTVEVNQQLAPSGIQVDKVQWQVLGEFAIVGGELTVHLTNLADGEVAADAIMIERINLLPLTPTISVSWSATTQERGGVLDFGVIDFGEQAERSLVITNTGAADLTLQPVTPPAGFTVVKNLSTNQRLGPGDSATVVLGYVASELTARSGELKVLSDDPDQPEFRINVSASRPPLTLGEAAIFVDGSEVTRGSGIVDFGDAPFDTTKTKTITVLNRGDRPLYLLEPQVVFNTWARGVNGTPGFEVTQLSQRTLAPGETATFSVSINAESSGVFVRRISLPVSGDPSDGEVFFMVRAAVNSPEIDVIVNSSTVTSGIDFGVTSLGVTVEREFVLKNPGAAPLVLQPASITGDFEIVNNVTSGQVINPGDEYALRVRFKATALPQAYGQLVIRSNDFNESTLTYALTATVGAARVEVTLNRPGYGFQYVSDGGVFDWGSVSQGNASETRILTIRNYGNQDLILQPITIPAGFSIVGGNIVSGRRVAPYTSATVILYLDTSVVGRRSGEVSIGTNDPDRSPFNFLMRATVGTVIDVTMAVNGAAVSEYARVDFGTLTYGTSVTKTFTVTNQGDIPLTLQPAIVPSGFTLVTNTTANQILEPGQSATLLVRFDAVTASGVGGYLILPTNDSNEGSFLLYLTGGLILGGNPVVTFNGAPLTPDAVIDFGRVSLGVAPIRTLHLANPTSEAILVAPWSGSSSVFILDDAGTILMPPGSTASIRIQMVADVLGERSVTIYPIGTGRVYFPIKTKITGRAFGEIDVNVSGVPVANQEIYDLGRDLPGTLTVRTLTVRNTGTSVLRLMPAVLAASGSYQPRFLSNFSRGQAVAVGATASILVEFPASQVGEYQWTISFGNSDADESSYRLLFRRSVLADAPEITVTFDGVDLPDNTGIIDFGSTYIGRPFSKTVNVSNIGFKDLIVQPVTVPDGFTIVRNFAVNQVIAPGQSWALEILMDAMVLATRSGQVAFLTNDANERPFDFHVSGSVIAPPSGWQFTIDDRDPGFAFKGAWGFRTLGSIGAGQRYTLAGSGTDVAAWTFDDLANGEYEVLATWKRVVAAATDSTYTLSSANGLIRSQSVSQKTNPPGPAIDGVDWISL